MTKLSQNLLIIGAGAHKPYRFPTSNDINKKLKDLLTAGKIIFVNETSSSHKSQAFLEKQRLCRKIMDMNLLPGAEKYGSNSKDIFIGQQLDEFIKSFAASSATSIDSYLSRIHLSKNDYKRTVYPTLGKFLLSYLISNIENQEPIGCQDADWIQFLIKEYIEPSPDEFFKSPPKIVTFNYDRLLERYIYEHLIEFHHMPEEEAKTLVDSLDILHVYGDLGAYTEWSPQSDSFYTEACSRIKVIGEDRDENSITDVRKKIKNIIEEATKIYFLGYGFDPINNDLIFKSLKEDWRKGKYIFSTNIGIGQRDRTRIYNQIGFLPAFLKKKSIHGDVMCLDLLKNLVPLEKSIKPKRKMIVKSKPFVSEW
ncbi:SIR2 family protein [Bdellovibrio bacteriovorus]|uniref:Uncharacterized protein n=1 Tax=Bdellovibrio bacteriovorus (strain ATCC 15356 / DSM 50701 / NCIMB 9529 / HD100) TaxID=264462 RepID=Q6MJT7_BDEBA|nr:SIR2 family protein [Bdellovibrio bacteriovorus]CAE80472.1 hypothetical protein predicted by Glimmer/Critica [Bdellovibrio bacteriovorus HD100]